MGDLPYTIAVDFDGTLCKMDWPGIGEPIEQTINMILKAKELDCKVILWTCREGARLQDAVEWCRLQGIEFDAVNENLQEWIDVYGNDCRKVGADLYIDDKALRMR